MRRILSLALVASSFALLAGCGPKPPAIPEFVSNPPSEKGKTFGSGNSEKQSLQLAKEVADAKACQEIANKLETKYSNLLQSHLEQDGMGKNAEATELAKSALKALTNMTLNGCEIRKREIQQGEGTYNIFSLAVLDNETATKALRSSLEAARSRVAAKINFDELDKAIQAESSK